jgi:hypothetical protein
MCDIVAEDICKKNLAFWGFFASLLSVFMKLTIYKSCKRQRQEA